MSLRKFWIPFLVLIVVGLMLFMLKALVFTDGTDWLMNIVDQVPLVGNLLSGFGSGIFTDDDTARQILNDWSLMIRVIELEIVKAELIGVIIYLLNEILGLFLSSLWRVILSSLLGVTMGLFIFKAFTFAGTWGPMLPLLILLAAAIYGGLCSYEYWQQNRVRVLLDVPLANQHPDYPTGCESIALYMLLRYYGTEVTPAQIVEALPKGPVPYRKNGRDYGANPEREFVGNPRDPHS